MIEFITPSVKYELNENDTCGTVTMEPLERGYGTTIGNALRRVLLSSLEGSAAVSIKINGGDVLHEFAVVDGVVEDVCEIILNIKGINAKIHGSQMQNAYINVTGPCEVTAGDIKCSTELEIINKDHHIATITGNESFYMELCFDEGMGYVSSDRNKEIYGNGEIGRIFVDSVYTPVQKVNFIVLNTRVGNVTDYDKLTLEVETNGVVDVRDAVSMASDILVKHFGMLMKSDDCEPSFNFKQKEEDAIIKILETGIEELELSVRSFNCLKRASINTVEDLTKMTEADMWRIRNLGKKSFDEITRILYNLGLSYSDEE